MNGLTQLLLKAGPTRLIAGLGVTAVVAALLFALIFRMGGEEKALLFANIDMREAGQITQKLEQANIPYELRGDGSSIFVARSKVLEARMMLEADGLPSHGSVGYEIFDNPDALGQTQFQQDINRLRALEGELARTIESLDGIAGARVHLVLPEHQLFSQDTQQPSASIVLQLKRDALTSGQVRAIRNLVASATPGLMTNRVTILDETGRLLAAATDGTDGADGADGVDEQEAAMEERIRHTVSDIVEGVVGAGNARVQVSADMDFDHVSETSEKYDPDGRVVRSTQTTETTANSSDRAQAQGATTAANVPDGAGANGGANGSTNANNSSQETINYELSRVTTTRVTEGGTIKRLSVAVAVDGTTAPSTNGHPGAWQPRSAEEMQHLTALVRSAVGFNEQRGDTVEVVNVHFARPDMTSEALKPPGMFDNLDLMRIIEIVAALIASLAFIFFVLRPLIGGLIRGGRPEAGVPLLPGASPGAVGSLPYAAALPAPDGALMGTGDEPSIDIAQIQGRVRTSSVKKVAEVIDQHPEESIQIIRGWLNNAM
ncbi:MAG: flagellar basal-body MS-ring/collar protein FliF [Terricaulis silvestris]